MAGKKEIERKWLIDITKVPFDLEKAEKIHMEQSYISFSPTVRLRAENGKRFVLCVKTMPSPDGLSRDEFETEITKENYENLLKKIDGNIIDKTRYIVNDGKHILEFDIFHGSLSGLFFMEIEFETEDEAKSYPDPEWSVKDVTKDKRYKNAYLARNGIFKD